MAGVRKNTIPTGTKIFLIIFFVIWGISFAAGIFSSSSSDEVVQSADGFTIDSYKVIMDVGENNIIDVTEEIIVNWYNLGHHGIYKFTPEWLEYTPQDGKTIKIKSKLSNYRAVGENYTVDIVNKKTRIKVGSANTTLPLGQHKYTIKYTYDMGTDPYKNFDEFIFHAYGDYWGTRINNASLEIHMPKNFDSSEITFWADKYRNKDITSYVNYYVNNNTLYATLSSNYNLQKSLTIDIGLPDGYFKGGNNNYGYISLALCLAVIGIAIFSFIKWRKHGKDYDRVIQTVEFYPPENYDSAQVGYIYGKQTSKKLTIALIVQLASKGYIQINETGDNKKKTRTIINLCPKHSEEDMTHYINAERRTVVVSKLKDADNLLSDKEKKWMKYLFRSSNTKEIISAFDEFYKETENLIDKYIKIESDITDNATDIDKDIEEAHKQINKQIESLPSLTEAEQLVYDQLFKISDTNELDKDSTFYTVFARVSASLEKGLKDKVNDKVATKQRVKTIILLIISVIAYYLAWVVFEDLNPSYSFIYTTSFVSLFATGLFAIIMGRKTKYGEAITAKVLGFRNYIEKAEKPQLEKLVEKNPYYFYDILPYAYAMNVSKTWIKNFENIPIPETNMGNFDYCDMYAFGSLSDSVYYPSSSSGSSCGGGCSSCGGGCSSCGGGGSW